MIDLLDRTLEELLRKNFQELQENSLPPAEETLAPSAAASGASGQPNRGRADIDQMKRDFSNSLGQVTFSFQQPKSGWNTTAQSSAVINLFLYDIRENAQLRRHQWEKQANGNNGDPRYSQQKRTPLRLDCFYLVTAWHEQSEIQHWLLASCLQILGRYPVLPEDCLQGQLKTQPYEIRAKLAAHDVLTNPAEVWSALGNDMHASFSYVLTIAIDPWTPIQVPVVTTVVSRVGQLPSPTVASQMPPPRQIGRVEDMLEEK